MGKKQDFLEALAEALAEENLSERDLANELERLDASVHPRRVMEWTSGVRAPSVSMIKKINSVLLSDLPFPIERDDFLKRMHRVGCTQSDVAKYSNIPLTTICDWLDGRATVDTEKLWKIEDALEKLECKEPTQSPRKRTRRRKRRDLEDEMDAMLVRSKTLKNLGRGDILEPLRGGDRRARIIKRLNDVDVVVEVWSVQNVQQVDRRIWTVDPSFGSHPEGQWVKGNKER